MIEPGGLGPLTPLVELRRGGQVESVHYGLGVIATSNGEILGVAGSSTQPFFPRSTLKPFQLEALLTHPRAAELELSEQEIAVLAASHDGEPIHIELIKGLLQRIGAEPSDLACGLPNRRIRDSNRPSTEMFPLYAECSGKHAAMLALARLLESPLETYLEPDHPAQVAIKHRVLERLGISENEIHVAIDGCGAPAFCVPIRSVAVAFAQLAASPGKPDELALRSIGSAMVSFPVLVGGSSGRIDTEAMTAAPGVIAKTGREGIVVLGHPNGIGCAIKVADGDPENRAIEAITATLLNATGWIRNTGAKDGYSPKLMLPERGDLTSAEVIPTPALEQFAMAATGVVDRDSSAADLRADAYPTQ